MSGTVFSCSLFILISTQAITSDTAARFGESNHSNTTVLPANGSSYNNASPRSNSASGAKIPLYLGTFFSLGGNWEGGGIVPAVEMGLDHVNTRNDVLPGYELRMVWNDTRCESGVATRVFFHQLQNSPQKIMILGPPCSPGSAVMAETGVHWNLLVLSYSAASPALSNREKYPYYFRTYISDTAFNPARIHLIKKFGWTRVATIHENYPLFSLAIDDLLTLLKANNITIIKSESFAENPKNQIENLKKSDAKIIIANTYANKARRLFCEAYKQGMTGPDYVWMLIGWWQKSWWELEDDTIDCPRDQLNQVVKQSLYISMESLPLSPSEEETIAGYTAAEFLEMYLQRMQWPENQRYLPNELATYGYDSVWTIALMLNETVRELETKIFSDNSTRRLEDFTYDDNEMAMIFLDKLSETRFIGTSGPVTFKNGDRQGLIKVEQLQADCPDSWVVFRSSCYYFGNEAITWSNARSHCHDDAADLVVIVTEDENEFVLLHMEHNTDGWFIGLKYDRVLQWVDQQPLNYTPGGNLLEDTPSGDRTCGLMNREGFWEITRCTNRRKFVCKRDQDYLEKTIALYVESEDIMNYVSEFQWADGIVPLDHTPEAVIIIVEEYLGVMPEIYFGTCVVASCGLVMALFFLGFNIKYRQQRYVKMSSPNLNNVIIMGTVFLYAAVFVFGLDNKLISPDVFEIMCQIRVWVLSLGFVIAFGAMFSKTWRVHRVATLKTPKRRVVTDKQLFLMVLVLSLIDIAILLAWQIMDPMQRKISQLSLIDDPDDLSRKILPLLEFCDSDHLTYWLGALYCYKGLLLIFGTFLAWETRKVTISALNDSKFIGMSVYNVIILCTIGVSVSQIINYNMNAAYLFLAAIDIFCTTFTLLMVFIPKIVSVMKYPEGQPVTTMSKSQRSFEINSVSGKTEDVVALQEKINELEAENSNLRKLHSARSTNDFTKSTASLVAGDNNYTHRGCGVWCFGATCGCYSPQDNYISRIGNQESEKKSEVTVSEF
ncbi:gamma-aminobutyric acid type B receptor subunit 2-like [Ptychodera flava]|uniref:gamma-aminobutyric acid type B receptor subunit 2-like n=1 Tax=Ptychodera flava TaxID=63121 RepID=UPI00396A79A7